MVSWNLQDKRRVFDRYLLAYLATQMIMFMFRSALAQETGNTSFGATGVATLAVSFEPRVAMTVL
jgi:hypothetical protein